MQHKDLRRSVFLCLMAISMLIEIGCGSNEASQIVMDQNELLNRRAADDQRSQSERNNFNKGATSSSVSIAGTSGTSTYANSVSSANSSNKNKSSAFSSSSSGGGSSSTAILALAFTGVAAWIAGPSIKKGMGTLLSKTGLTSDKKSVSVKSQPMTAALQAKKDPPAPSVTAIKQDSASSLAINNVCHEPSGQSAIVSGLSKESEKIFDFSQNQRSNGGAI